MKRIYKFICLWFVALLGYNECAAQVPANDNCSAAEFVYLDPSGNVCASGSNQFASGDGYSNACDAGALAPLPPGGHEVWYTYIAAGPVNNITVTPIGGSAAQTASITVSNGNCGVGGTYVCNSAINPLDPVSVAFSTTAGSQVWFSVTSLVADGDFLVCINSSTGFLAPGNSCASAVNICNKLDFTSPGTAVTGTSVTPSCFNSPPVRKMWYKFTVGTAGPLEFSAFPNNVGGFRWAMYDITAGCPGTEVACNNIYDPFQPFGLSSSVASCGANPYCPPVNVVAGNTYALMIDDTSQSGSGFDFTWGSNVKLLPTADFSIDSTVACGSLTLDFTNLSTFNASSSYVLNYGDGSPNFTGTGASFTMPSHTYGPGVYVVELTVTQPGGCSNSFSRQITVNAKPTATFSISADSSCYDGVNPIVIDFASSYVSANANYSWDYPSNSGITGTGIGQNSVFWNTSGVIPVYLVITENNCPSDTIRDSVYIFDFPTSTFTMSDTGCAGVAVNVAYTGNGSSFANYSWNYAGGTVTNATNQAFDISWAAAGIYNVSLTIQDHGCLSFPTQNPIEIFTRPTLTVNPPANVCLNDTLLVSPIVTGTPGVQYIWDFGNSNLISGNPANGTPSTFSWNTVGTTYWKAFALSAEGCLSDADSVSTVVNDIPTSTFSVTDNQVCGGDSTTLTFTGATPNLGTTYNWNVSTSNVVIGATNTAGPLTLTFPTAGTYPLYLYVSDNVCASDTTRDTIFVGTYPLAVAGIDTGGCSGTPINIGTTPTVGYTYLWTPASFMTGANTSAPQVAIPNNGTIDSTSTYVVAVTQVFCTSTDTIRIRMRPSQKARFNRPGPQCFEGNLFDFRPAGAIVSGATYAWSFGPNALPDSSFISSPSGIGFTTTGWQVVTLNTTSGNCPADSYIDSVFVKPNPLVSLSANDYLGCPPLDVTFTNSSPALAGSSALWDFGNGDTSSTSNPTYTYNNSGTFTPSLTITSADTCSTTENLTQPIEVGSLANATFDASPLVVTNLNPVVTFEALFPGTICYFDFGDGNGDSSCFAQHTYQDSGTYEVTFYTENAAGCWDTSSLTIKVQSQYLLHVPSAFTPNKDARNDVFQIFADGVKTFEFAVFNRRGQIVWETSNPDATWNGNYLGTGEPCPDGVYVYTLKAKDVNNKRREQTGRITIIR